MRIMYAKHKIQPIALTVKEKMGELWKPALIWNEKVGSNPAVWQTLLPYKRILTGEYMMTARHKKYARTNMKARKKSKR